MFLLLERCPDVHAVLSTDASQPQEVLKAVRDYVKEFFGCRECAEHFVAMATEGLWEVKTLSGAVTWLWTRHNRVNNRLAGEVEEEHTSSGDEAGCTLTTLPSTILLQKTKF